MITVRYPSGIVVTYNDANFLTHDKAGDWTLSRRVNGNDSGVHPGVQGRAISADDARRG